MPNGSQPADPIQHVVVMMFENRSFDHMLGCCQKVHSGLDGIPEGTPRTNSDAAMPYPQVPGAARTLVNDPKHELENVLAQLADHNSGFVLDYAHEYPSSPPAERAEVMKYHDLDTLPALHKLARYFLVCDQWFASVPGPTWPNRLFAMSGTSAGRVKMPSGIMNLDLHWYDQATVFDRLNERNQPWKVYFGDVPLSLLLVHQWQPQNAARHFPMTTFFADAAGPPEQFPAFAWIEPSYLDPHASDDHPPHDVFEGEALLAAVYNALRANEALWQTTLLIVLYDEHGGFYDHVEPPVAIAPDYHQEEFTFDRLGVRVPVVLISPWVGSGVCSTSFDHTSLLRFLQDKWNLGPLGARADQAATFHSVILPESRDTPPMIVAPLGGAPPSAVAGQDLTEHQSAIVALSHALESMGGEDPAVIAARSQHILSGAQSQMDAAVDRVEAFLRNKRAQAG